jgi:ATP-dependent RNA helicase RhlE
MALAGFDRFGLNDTILRGIRAAGFETPRPIQFETIPSGLKGRDVLGLAQTGTGKTAAFTLPILERLNQHDKQAPRALILAPTRELATQITKEMKTLSRYTDLKIVTIFGGVRVSTQANALRGRPDIVVGCPGRVLDLLKQGMLLLNQVETLVLDEADHMFDMGFLPDIKRIIKALPRERQNLLFSATMPREIRGLANEVLKTPHVVELADSAPASTIDHALYLIPENKKRDLLDHILQSDECNSAIVFVRTKRRAKRLADSLRKDDYKASDLQGNMSQGQRDRAMRGFRERRFDILVATDIAARGIDVSNVSHVINFDVPTTPEAYTHRIGRTGRSEQAGIACTFVTGVDRGWVRATERMIGSPIRRERVEGFEPDIDRKPAATVQRRGKRPSGQKWGNNKNSGRSHRRRRAS